MKKFITILMIFIPILCNAQIYTEIWKIDRFDDVVSIETKKTRISETDSTIIIETKGEEPVTYIKGVGDSIGNKDNPINLVGNLYGYETHQNVIPAINYDAFMAEFLDTYSIEDEIIRHAAQTRIVQKYYLTLVHRTITSQYTKEYTDDLI